MTLKFAVSPECDTVNYERNIPTFQKPNDRGVPKRRSHLPDGKRRTLTLTLVCNPTQGRFDPLMEK